MGRASARATPFTDGDPALRGRPEPSPFGAVPEGPHPDARTCLRTPTLRRLYLFDISNAHRNFGYSRRGVTLTSRLRCGAGGWTSDASAHRDPASGTGRAFGTRRPGPAVPDTVLVHVRLMPSALARSGVCLGPSAAPLVSQPHRWRVPAVVLAQGRAHRVRSRHRRADLQDALDHYRATRDRARRSSAPSSSTTASHEPGIRHTPTARAKNSSKPGRTTAAVPWTSEAESDPQRRNPAANGFTDPTTAADASVMSMTRSRSRSTRTI